MHVILLKTIYWMSSHQNVSIGLISVLQFSQLPLFTYRFRQYLLRETKIRFIVSARCANTVTMDRFTKFAKFPGLVICIVVRESIISRGIHLTQFSKDFCCKRYRKSVMHVCKHESNSMDNQFQTAVFLLRLSH